MMNFQNPSFKIQNSFQKNWQYQLINLLLQPLSANPAFCTKNIDKFQMSEAKN